MKSLPIKQIAIVVLCTAITTLITGSGLCGITIAVFVGYRLIGPEFFKKGPASPPRPSQPRDIWLENSQRIQRQQQSRQSLKSSVEQAKANMPPEELARLPQVIPWALAFGVCTGIVASYLLEFSFFGSFMVGIISPTLGIKLARQSTKLIYPLFPWEK